jgi:diguanylate cyclase (GGDEF)-like protein
MGLKIKSKWDVWVFTVLFVAICVIANAAIDLVSLAFAPKRYVLLFGGLATALLCLPLALLIGCRILAIYARSKDIEQAARFDSLTGTMTRDAFLYRAKRLTARPGVLIMVDIDNFKAFNDRHGHLAGDAALRQVAQKLIRCTRKGDLVARFGGEEFLVLLPDTTLADGKRAARELRELLHLTPVIVDGAPVPVTASFGVSPIAADETIDQALSRADSALYRAKRSGRDKVCIAA